MSTLADVVHIERRFARSARLDADLKGTPPLVGYILQGSIKKALASMAAAQIEAQQGAFTWTGPYGGGKSSAALLVGNLVGGGREGQEVARKLAGSEISELFGKAFPKRDKAWAVVPVTGTRTELRDAIAIAAAAALRWPKASLDRARASDEALVRALLDACKARGGVLLILDELGKFLEHAVTARYGDVHLLQDLAEHSSRSDGRLVVVGILHQAFDRYAGRLSREARQEWAKVQGRFQDISFLAGADETVALLGRAIVADRHPSAAAELAGKVARAVAARRPTDDAALAEALSATWPLNPVTALLLGPVSRQRFAQNERSVFGFLSSAEPHGFVEFLKSQQADTLATFGPDRLWDYLVTNFGMALATGTESARFSLALEAIDRAAAKGGALHAALTKCAAVIEPFRNGSGLAVAGEFLEAALPEIPAPDLAAAIADLVEWAVLMRQPRLGGYALFAGSDFDLEQAVEEARGTLDAEELAALPQRVGLGFVVAKRHYFRTGTLRAFELVVYIARPDDKPKALAAELGRRQPRGAGLMVLLLSDDSDSVPPPDMSTRGEALAKELDELGVVAAVAASQTGNRVRDEAADLFALEKVAKEHPQLQGDRIARREIAARRSVLLDAIQRDLTEALDDATWWIGPNEGEALRDSVSVIATALADAAYHKTPILKSELVQRDRPSSNAMAAIRDLGHAMVEAEAKPNLGLTSYPPEMGLYLTVLRPFGLHREIEPDVFAFVEPDKGEAGCSLRPVWNVLEEAAEVTLDQIFTAWAKPPFGLKAGVMPILALASILARRERLAVYVDGLFQTSIDTIFVDRLLQDPTTIRLKRVNRTAHEAGILSGLALRLGVAGEPAALPVAQALFQRFQGLPGFAQRTEQLSERAKAVRSTVLKANDPEALLFHALPAQELGDDPAAAVVDALIEAETIYPALLAELRRELARVLGTDPATFDGVAARAGTIAGLTSDLRFEAFVTRTAAFEGGEGEIEGLASLLAHKPPHNWSDRDRNQALLDLALFGRRFRETEALAAVRERSSTAEALALVIGLDPEKPPLLASFEVTEGERKEANHLAKLILNTLGRRKADRNVRFAALARVIASLSGETEKETT